MRHTKGKETCTFDLRRSFCFPEVTGGLQISYLEKVLAFLQKKVLSKAKEKDICRGGKCSLTKQ